MKIVIQKRYQKEVLTNRAGNSPNKGAASFAVSEPCLVPYTDLTIYPSGQVGLCCSDVLETQNFGSCAEDSLLAIYNGPAFRAVRKEMARGRFGLPFCKNCDFIDSGIRLHMMKGTT